MKKDYRAAIAEGNFGENFVRRVLDNAGIPNEKNKEKSDRARMLDYDLHCRLGGRRFTVEVKYDKMAARTGNVAVEYRNVRQDKPSGILATKSDLWVFVFSNPVRAYVTSTKRLRAYFDLDRPHRNVACGGDQNAAMKLYKMTDILPAVFARLDGLPPEGVVSLLGDLLNS